MSRSRGKPEAALLLIPGAAAWREFHENKTARLPFVNPSAEYARTLTTPRHSEDRARAQRNLAQAYSSGTAGVGGTHTHNTHGGVDPPS
jgi:hypothetical protein